MRCTQGSVLQSCNTLFLFKIQCCSVFSVFLSLLNNKTQNASILWHHLSILPFTHNVYVSIRISKSNNLCFCAKLSKEQTGKLNIKIAKCTFYNSASHHPNHARLGTRLTGNCEKCTVLTREAVPFCTESVH